MSLIFLTELSILVWFEDMSVMIFMPVCKMNPNRQTAGIIKFWKFISMVLLRDSRVLNWKTIHGANQIFTKGGSLWENKRYTNSLKVKHGVLINIEYWKSIWTFVFNLTSSLELIYSISMISRSNIRVAPPGMTPSLVPWSP